MSNFVIFNAYNYTRMRSLILDYKVDRKEAPSSGPYRYNRNLGLNVMTIAEQEIPFIDIDNSLAETMTKTKGEPREGDESHHLFLELQTKTKVKREQDDMASPMLELTTKTLTSRETDDVRNVDLLELMTKTRAQRERDDEHNIDN
jgi:hypothetical protein